MSWIVIPGWDHLQHYKDRDPKWIKNYVSLLHHDGYLSLSGHTRSVLHGLWLVYASSHGHVRVDTASLSRQLGLRVSSVQLESLSDAGFIEVVASKPLSLARSREKSREKEKTRARENGQQNAVLAAREEETEPPRDPNAAERARELASRIGRVM